MPILLVIFLVAACSPVAWPPPPTGGERAAMLIALAAFLLPVIGHLALTLWALRTLKQPPLRNFAAARFSRLRRLLGLAHFALAIIAIVCGWGWLVQRVALVDHDGLAVVAPFAELLVPLPYLLGVFSAWLIHHDTEKVLHESSANAENPYWTRGGHFLHRLRPFLLLVLVPVALFAAHQSLVRFAREFAESSGVQIAIAMSTPLLFLLMPLLAKPALGLKSLPPGPHRERLEETARRLNFRCADLLLWPTQRTVANAMVLGLMPQARFVVFTDQLLEHLDDDELEAVFGHEVGHVKHWHLLYYACFLILSMMVILTAAAGLVNEAVKAEWITEAEANSQWLAMPPMAILAAYLFLVFGLLSRKCERQADLYGVRTVASGRVEGHPLAAGVYSMQRALGKVAYVNGLDLFANESASFRQRVWARILSWQHGSIADRIEFLHRILDDPTLEDRAQRRIAVFRWFVILVLLLALVALGSWIEWPNVVKML